MTPSEVRNLVFSYLSLRQKLQIPEPREIGEKGEIVVAFEKGEFLFLQKVGLKGKILYSMSPDEMRERIEEMERKQ